MAEGTVTKKKVKTTFEWKRSPGYEADIMSMQKLEKAAVCVKIAVGGVEQPEQILPADTTQVTVEAFENDHVIVFVSYRNRHGVNSKARGYDIHVVTELVPEPVGEIKMAAVAVAVSLNTII